MDSSYIKSFIDDFQKALAKSYDFVEDFETPENIEQDQSGKASDSLPKSKKQDLFDASNFFLNALGFLESRGHNITFEGIPESFPKGVNGTYDPSKKLMHVNIKHNQDEGFKFNTGEMDDQNVVFALAHEIMHAVDHFLHQRLSTEKMSLQEVKIYNSVNSYILLKTLFALEDKPSIRNDDFDLLLAESMSLVNEKTNKITDVYSGKSITELVPRLVSEYGFHKIEELKTDSFTKDHSIGSLVCSVLEDFSSCLDKYHTRDENDEKFLGHLKPLLEKTRSDISKKLPDLSDLQKDEAENSPKSLISSGDSLDKLLESLSMDVHHSQKRSTPDSPSNVERLEKKRNQEQSQDNVRT